MAGGSPGRQPDLALGHGEPGQRVHHEDDVVALVTEPLGDPGGGEGGPDPDQGGLVGGGHDDHRAGQALGTEVTLDELVDLPATLAHQGHDRHRRVGAPGHHGEQARLAHPGPGEDAETLAPTAGDEGVDGLDPEGQLTIDQLAPQRMGRCRVDAHFLRFGEGRSVVDGSTEAVEDPTEQPGADLHRQGTAQGLDGVAEAHPGQIAERHAGQGRPGHGDHLGVEDPTAPPDPHRFAHGGRHALRPRSGDPTRRVTRPVRRGATAACSEACRGWGMTRHVGAPPVLGRPNR